MTEKYSEKYKAKKNKTKESKLSCIQDNKHGTNVYHSTFLICHFKGKIIIIIILIVISKL